MGMGTPAANYVEPVRRFVASPVRTSEVNVIFTTTRGTLAAMRAAAALSRASGAAVRLIDPRPVHFPLRSAGYALAAAPEVPIEERERERVIAAAGVPVDVQVYICGHPSNATRAALRERSLVIVGGRRSWWPTPLERLQRELESQGHVVMFVNESED
jgi:hypothetical protein